MCIIMLTVIESIAYLACCADMTGIVSFVTVWSKNARLDTEEGGTWEGKRSGGTGKGE